MIKIIIIPKHLDDLCINWCCLMWKTTPLRRVHWCFDWTVTASRWKFWIGMRKQKKYLTTKRRNWVESSRSIGLHFDPRKGLRASVVVPASAPGLVGADVGVPTSPAPCPAPGPDPAPPGPSGWPPLSLLPETHNALHRPRVPHKRLFVAASNKLHQRSTPLLPTANGQTFERLNFEQLKNCFLVKGGTSKVFKTYKIILSKL